jgi:hypothetical protein
VSTHYEARLVGGPANGRVYAMPQWADSIWIAQAPDLRTLRTADPDAPVPVDDVEYVPVGVVITYAPRF